MNVLFVCTGNTCRSPMAAAIFNHQWNGKGEAKSVGLFAMDGENAASNTINVLKDNGIHLDHQSRMLTEQHLSWAYLVLTMTASHKEMMVRQYPGAADKIFTLKEFVNGPNGDLDIIDPYGGDQVIYETTFNELNELISRIFEKI